MKTGIRFDLIGLIIAIFGLHAGSLYCQNIVIKYTILRETDSGFELAKKNASVSETKKNFFEKFEYNNNYLKKVCLYDKKGHLYDGVYNNAITTYEYSNNKLKYKKLYDKNKRRVENGFMGYWAIEFFYDRQGRIIKKTYIDKQGSPLKYNPNTDEDPPYVEYEYMRNGKCIEKSLDNNYKIIRQDTCVCPCMKIKLNEY
ncbi:hypothetical protein [Microbacter margulisiae]|uniref:Uncharacterized protein n=1 Tax=Microbacter margulisiae TaxID=1350067 RepID=A0A7W5H2K8_9PORP|nr:hypothetical protein [Microbacter margulisiae]MBB3187865.1 hypothetical protein [Microbacter margulisiae]